MAIFRFGGVALLSNRAAALEHELAGLLQRLQAISFQADEASIGAGDRVVALLIGDEIASACDRLETVIEHRVKPLRNELRKLPR